ncbi:MAG: citrate/2-methylcitrate synthase [Spirochaetales bacterium]|nr:citrate/2-methylcitrate synthase [Spirochaetales bacterium]
MAKQKADDLTMIQDIILNAKEAAQKEIDGNAEPEFTQKISWPVDCKVGPGLEGAIACETEIGYVNGSMGYLIYRGYDIFDLCAYSSFEEVSYLLLFGELPSKEELKEFKESLNEYRHLLDIKRLLMSFPLENMNPMAALRLGINFMRHKQTYRDQAEVVSKAESIATDEDSIAMETPPRGERKSIYEFRKKQYRRPKNVQAGLVGSEGVGSCIRLIAGLPTIVAAIARIRKGHLPIEPDTSLTLAGNFLYMLTGEKPTPLAERIMDICLILHADHGMNASTFAAMVVASTLSDVYSSVEAGVAALNGPLHGGANEQVLLMLNQIGSEANVEPWFAQMMKKKRKIMGFGHRVYKAYDPRARILGPLAKMISATTPELRDFFKIAQTLEKVVNKSFGKDKNIFPNVDYYSGLVYKALNIDHEIFTPIFAVSRVSGWCARVLEYLEKNRIFRPRAIYNGEFNKKYTPINKRK